MLHGQKQKESRRGYAQAWLLPLRVRKPRHRLKYGGPGFVGSRQTTRFTHGQVLPDPSGLARIVHGSFRQLFRMRAVYDNNCHHSPAVSFRASMGGR